MKLTRVLSCALTPILCLSLAACAGAPRRPKNNRELFQEHWLQSGDKVQTLQIADQPGGWVRGSGLIDGRPVEEFYNPTTGVFQKSAPTWDNRPVEVAQKQLYKDMLAAATKELSDKAGGDIRIAVLDFPSLDKRKTQLSEDIASRIETTFVDLGRNTVDHGQMEKVMAEHSLQQKESGLFDAANVARLGKFMGANAVVFGTYSIVQPHTFNISLKMLSVETTRILAKKELEIPLTGEGADNKDFVVPLDTEIKKN